MTQQYNVRGVKVKLTDEQAANFFGTVVALSDAATTTTNPHDALVLEREAAQLTAFHLDGTPSIVPVVRG